MIKQLKIIRMFLNGDFVCSDSTGKRYVIDLRVGGELDRDTHTDDSLIGKTIEAEITPYCYIANDIKILE